MTRSGASSGSSSTRGSTSPTPTPVTGDADYLRTWEDLVQTFCDQVPVGFDPSEVSARRIQNWLYAWQRFAAAPTRSTVCARGLSERLVARLHDDVAHLAANLTSERNHRTLELYTLVLAGLALDNRSDAERALELLAENALTDIWADGVHRECSTDYHCLVLRSLLGAIANARTAGMDVPEALLQRAGLACDVALHLQRPDGVTPALSDGDPGRVRRAAVAWRRRCSTDPICAGRRLAVWRANRPGNRRRCFPWAATSSNAPVGAMPGR